MLFYKLLSSFKIMGAIKDINIKLWTQISQLPGKISKIWTESFEPSIMHANFQVSSFSSVGGEWGDTTPHPYTKFLYSPLVSLRRDKGVWVVIWFKAGILSWQPGFDSRAGKTTEKKTTRVPFMSYKDSQGVL